MPVRIGINGFGRIGRNIMRAAMGDTNIDFVAVNDLTSAKTLAHLLKYDSVWAICATVEAGADSISVDGDEFKVLSLRIPAQLPWKDLAWTSSSVDGTLHRAPSGRQALRRRVLW